MVSGTKKDCEKTGSCASTLNDKQHKIIIIESLIFILLLAYLMDTNAPFLVMVLP